MTTGVPYKLSVRRFSNKLPLSTRLGSHLGVAVPRPPLRQPLLKPLRLSCASLYATLVMDINALGAVAAHVYKFVLMCVSFRLSRASTMDLIR